MRKYNRKIPFRIHWNKCIIKCIKVLNEKYSKFLLRDQNVI